MRYNTGFRAAMWLGALMLAPNAAEEARSQASAAEAISLVEQYIATHNSHNPAATLAYYAKDADFHLSMGRGVVSGVDAIARLEEFDAAAGSTLYPQNLTARLVDERWVVGFDNVVEYSEVFSALGLRIVLAQGMETGFVFRDGRIEALYQPDLYPACTAMMSAGFQGLLRWLSEDGNSRGASLLRDGRLHLTGDTAPLLVAAAREWRAQSGWAPTADGTLACAGTRRQDN